ncbi:MAG: hypothetical protein ACAI25_10370, partial [Planctomycetota bacterium]
MSDLSPEAQLDECLAAFDEEIAALAVATLARVRELVPGAHELVYDAYNALSVGFGSGPKLGDCFLHVATYPKNVNLGFHRGTELEDPHGLLVGTGKLIRHVPMLSTKYLKSPKLAKLVRAA